MDDQVSYTSCTPLKRESIVRMVTLSKKNVGANAGGAESTLPDRRGSCELNQVKESFSLLLVSAKGRVAVYDVSLKLIAAFTLSLGSAPVTGTKAPLSSSARCLKESCAGTPSGQPAPASVGPASATKSIDNGVVVKKVKRSLFGPSVERCLHFFTTVATPYVERFRIDGMKDIPTALAYLAPGGGRTEPFLGVGDDGGDVFVLRFKKSFQPLFKKREIEREPERVYWRELHLQADLLTLTVLPGSHRSRVIQVDLKQAMQRVISCSKNSFTSLAIRHIRQEQSTGALPSVILRNAPGIACFDYDDEKGLIVTGSSDGKIRLWSPTHLAKPWMVLTGHTNMVVGILLVEQSAFLWSVCDQSELRYWNLDDGICLKSMELTFTKIRGSHFHYGMRPLMMVDTVLYVVCGDSIASLPLKRPVVRTSIHLWEDTEGLSSIEEEIDGAQKAAESKIPHRYREGLLDFGYRAEEEVFRKFISELQGVFADSVTVANKLKEIEHSEELLVETDDEKEQNETTYEWEAEFDSQAPVTSDLIPINQIKLRELESIEEMKQYVNDGIPFCGLKLTDPQQCKLPQGLPVTKRMRKYGIEEFQTVKEVRNANFDMFSEKIANLSSPRTEIASSLLPYFRQRKVNEKVTVGDSELLVVFRSRQSSRKSSITSAVSALSTLSSLKKK